MKALWKTVQTMLTEGIRRSKSPAGYVMGTGKTYRTNGAKEMARRRQQLAAGIIHLN